MKITLAKTAGFCFGVDRAVQTVYDLLEKGERVCTLGPIIHNDQMVKELESKGIRTVSSYTEVLPGETLVIRSHGVPAAVFEETAGIKTVDATCPFVAKIHKIVAEKSAEGYITVIAGDASHQEVIGIVGHCTGEYYVVSGAEQFRELLEKKENFSGKKVILVAQTTFNAEIWKEIQKISKKVCTNAKIFDTICNATSMRQQETRKLAAENDVMIVIGGRHSSNTAKLFDVCKEECGRAYLIETAAELTGGGLEIQSKLGEGTKVTATFVYDSIDRMPLGDTAFTMVTLVSCNPDIDFVYTHTYNGKSFEFSTKKIKEVLNGVFIGEQDVLHWIEEYIADGLCEIKK